MIRSFGVARVMSVKAMQIFVSGEMRSSNGWLPIGFCSAPSTAACSSAKPVDVRRLDDRRSVVGNLNGKMAGAVCQVDCHS